MRNFKNIFPYLKNNFKNVIYTFSWPIGGFRMTSSSQVLYQTLNEQFNNSVTSQDVSVSESQTSDCSETAEGEDDFCLPDQARAVGITQFLNDHGGFHGVFKKRWDDFIVNEILLNREVVRLTRIEHTEICLPPKSPDFKQSKIQAILRDYLTDDMINYVTNLHEGIEVAPTLINIDHLKEGCRKMLHTCFQVHMPKLKARSKTIDSKKFLYVESTSNKVSSELAPGNKQYHLHFILSKINTTAFEAFYQICNILKITTNKLCFAGLKDKRAVTTQMVSISHEHLFNKKTLLFELNNIPNIKVGNFTYKSEPVALGNIYGNHFEIIIRDVSAPMQTIESAVRNVQRSGFINYFGLQRFGSAEIPYMEVGKLLFQRKWEEAVEMILKPRNLTENISLSECRSIWWKTRNPNEALKALHHTERFSREALLLKGLIRYGAKEYRAALTFVPKPLLKFYFHSYDSYVWNCVVSRRLEAHGLNLVEGDFIRSAHPNCHRKKNTDEVFVVKRSELQMNDISIFDIVVPIFGSRVPIPKGKMGELFHEILGVDGLSEKMMNSHELFYKYGLYRRVVAVPENLNWSIFNYDDPNQRFLVTDFDRLQEKENIELPKSGEKKALKLEFDLKSSCYATMMLREIMKF